MAFTAPDGGTVNPVTGATLDGTDNTTFTAPVVVQAYQVCTEVDNELLCVIVALNNAPVATANTYNMDEDTVLNIATPGVLTNDTDADGDTLTAVLVTKVSSGTLVLNANGSFTYTPNANFFGTDTFIYHANDGKLDSNDVTVTITVADIPETQYIHLPIIRK
jgi:VCBS repeat-containing protein